MTWPSSATSTYSTRSKSTCSLHHPTRCRLLMPALQVLPSHRISRFLLLRPRVQAWRARGLRSFRVFLSFWLILMDGSTSTFPFDFRQSTLSARPNSSPVPLPFALARPSCPFDRSHSDRFYLESQIMSIAMKGRREVGV